MPYNFDQLNDRTGTSSQKWEKYANSDIIPMWVADTDFLSPPAVIDALRDRIDQGLFGYTDTPQSLNRVFLDRMQNLYNWALDADSLIWLPGLVSGLHLATRTACTQGESAITALPVYPPFTSAPKLSERGLITLPLKRSHGRSVIDIEQLRASIDPQTRILLFCNPHNPGGAVYRRAELEALAAVVIEHDLLICSDEIHCDLILEPELKHIPTASLSPDIARRCITLMAPSKTWNIAGLGCAVAIIENPELRACFKRLRKGIVSDVNLLGYTAAEAAYRDGEDWNRSQIEYLRGNRDLLMQRINQIDGLKLDPIEATYLAWIDVSGADLGDPVSFFESAGVGMSPGRDFGSDSHMRLNFGCPRERLEQAISRIETAMRQR